VRFSTLLVLPVLACGSSSGGTGDAGGSGTDAPMQTDSGVPLGPLPPVNAGFDYQLGGAYPPPAGVMAVSRDRKDAPAPGLYNICYVNGFQIDVDDESYWLDNHPDLILRDTNGNPVIDAQWNEMLLDIGLAEKRAAISSIIGSRIRQCADYSYNAIEIDNLDSYTRSQGLLTQEHAVMTMKMLANAAHALGRPIGQKNSSELVARRSELGTDFAISEECNRYSECDVYTAGYGDHVIVIEYRQQDFAAGCAAYPNLSIVLRDVNLVTPSTAGYVYDGC
jgi:hypothetical protein